MKNLITLLSLALCMVFANTSFAVVGPAAPVLDENTELNEKVIPQEMTKKELRQQKKIKKFQKKLQKMQDKGQGVDFSDPVNKWMWFWIFGWGLALLLSILVPIIFLSGGTGIGGAVGLAAAIGLIGLFGTVSLIIWLIKKFA